MNTYKDKKVIICEVLVIGSFLLNTFCVLTAKELHGAAAPVWLPRFDVVYWLKTFLAISGAFFFVKTKEKFNQENRFLSILIFSLIVYSIPGLNFILALPFNIIFSGVSTLKNQGITFQSRIPTQIAWSIPVFVLAVDLVKRIFKIKSKRV
jgi:hypothetical protein